MVPGDSAKLTNREAGAAAPPPLPGYATARVDLYLGLKAWGSGASEPGDARGNRGRGRRCFCLGCCLRERLKRPGAGQPSCFRAGGGEKPRSYPVLPGQFSYIGDAGGSKQNEFEQWFLAVIFGPSEGRVPVSLRLERF